MIDKAVTALRDGGVVLYPTTTLFGVGGDARLPGVAARVRQKKGIEGPTRPFLLLVGSIEEVRRLAVVGTLAERLMGRYWPGDMTLLLPARPLVPKAVIGRSEWVGLRLAQHPIPRCLIAETGAWLISTSANRTGEAPPTRLDEVDSAIRAGVDVVINGPPAPSGAPSTVVRVDGDRMEVVREGRVRLLPR